MSERPFYPSESVTDLHPDMTFQYLEENVLKEITRARAHELRAEGLQAFNEELLLLAKERHGSVVPNDAIPIYKWAYKVLHEAPLYFWVIPSSSSGKYHPAFSQGEQGLVKHVIAVMYYAMEFSRTFGLNDLDSACAIAAAAIHDMCKYGLEYNVRYFGVHECLVRVKLGKKETNLEGDLPRDVYDKIIRAVETHNGNIARGDWTAFRIPPADDIARVVHMADYTASRKRFVYDI